MMSRAITLRFLFLLALPIGPAADLAPAAYAQVASPDALGERLDPETAAAVRSIIESAAPLGVPGEPLVAKALEGHSKGATGQRILVAVHSLVADLTVARGALGGSATSAELVAGAGALRSGASEDVLRRIKAVRGARSALLPLATLTDLVARGVPVDRAAGTVLALAERGASEADYRAQGSPAGSQPGGAGPPGGVTPGAGMGPPSAGVPHPVPVPTPGTPPPGAPSNVRPPAQ